MRKRKKVLVAVLALFFAYVVWLGWRIANFKTYVTAPSVSLKTSAAEFFEIQGAYHIHTRFSDGHKTPDEIARIAHEAGLDFIILTDHGRPNYSSLDAQERKAGVLVLAGSELSVNRGHMVGLGFSRPSRDFSSNAEAAAHEISALGGFTIIAHPYSKVRWSWGEPAEYGGIEIMDMDSMLKKNFLGSLLFLPALLVKQVYAALKMIDPPVRNLQKWDRLAAFRPIYGYFSADAHFFYSAALSVFHLHVLLDEKISSDFSSARTQIFNALRRGYFFNAVDAAAAARGFRFWAEISGKMFPMGDTIFTETESSKASARVTFRLAVPFSFAHETRLLRNGQMMMRSPEQDIFFDTADPGVYRAEVYLREKSPLDPEVPWIISNPIFVRKARR